jgi:type VI secretion system secreted protein VgrG
LSIEGRALRVLGYDLRESLDEVGLLTCEVVEDGHDAPDPAELSGKKAELTLERERETQTRKFFGRVVEAARAPDADDVRTVRLVIASTLWQLEKRASSRIFQEKSTVDIVKEVLEGGGVAADQQEWRTSVEYAPRVYTVQYRETDLDFIRRLLAEEGIYFAVHSKDGKDVVVLSDDPRGLGEVAGTATLPFQQEFGASRRLDVVQHVAVAHAVRSDKVHLRDYDPERPKLQLDGKAEGGDDGAHVLEVYDYPGRFADAAIGKRYAEVLCESMQAQRHEVTGEAGSLELWPGLRFEIDSHPYEPINQEYLVVATHLAGSSPRLGALARGGPRGQSAPATAPPRCEFRAIPTATSRYRPSRRARAALVNGLSPALTTGAPGEEIHTDAHGHVKARYFWDRESPEDDTSSRWMRTSQAPTGGSMLLPRVGWEVIVAHLEGDPDRPVVMGRLYNALSPPPYALPENKGRSSLQTATSPGGGSTNELRMGDDKGSEQMMFNASKDMSIDVKNNVTESVGNDSAKKVGSNQKKNVTNSVTASVGSNQTLSVAGNQSVSVETFMVDEVAGNHSLSIGGNRDMKIGGDHKRDVSGSSTLAVNGMQVDLVVGSVTDKTLASHTHNVSAALVELTAADRSLLVGGARTENTGAVKIIAVKGGRGVEVGGTFMQKVGGAIINSANADKTETAGAGYTEVAAGAQVIKAANVTFEAENMLSVVMGASTVTLMPAMVAIAGVSVKLDGDTADTATMVIDN